MEKCKHCDYSSYSSLIVKRHSIITHGFECHKCDFISKSKKAFHQHKQTHPTFGQCLIEDCGFMGSKENVRKHQEDIHGITALSDKKCNRCDYSTTNRSSLRIHIKRFSKSGIIFFCSKNEIDHKIVQV